MIRAGGVLALAAVAAACQHGGPAPPPTGLSSADPPGAGDQDRAEWLEAGASYQDGVRALAAKDYPQAEGLLTGPAEEGYLAAQLALAQLHLERGAAGDRERALRWLRRAAEAGDASAELALALVLQRNRGDAAEAAEAVRWLTRASDRGSVEATFQLALAHHQGTGVPRNPLVAADYFERAARRGSISSQYNLGTMIRDGLGRPRSPSEALAWVEFAIAGAAPGPQREAFLRTAGVMRDGMTAEEVARAEARRAALEVEIRARRGASRPAAAPGRGGRVQFGLRTESDWLARNLVEHVREPLRTTAYMDLAGQTEVPLAPFSGGRLRTNGSLYVGHPLSGRPDRALQYAAINISPLIPSWTSGPVAIHPFMTADLTGLDWARFASSYGAGVNLTRRLDSTTSAGVTLLAMQRDYQTSAKYRRNGELSGLRTSVAGRLVRRIGPAATGAVNLGYLHGDAAQAWRRHDQADAGASLSLRLRNPIGAGAGRPIRASTSVSLAWRDFDLPDPLLAPDIARRDRDLALRASLEAPVSRRVSLGASASRFERESNLRVYDYRALEGAVWVSLTY